MNRYLIKIILLFFVTQFVSGQTKSNLEMINGLLDSSATEIKNKTEEFDNTYFFSIIMPSEYQVLDSRVVTSLVKKNIRLEQDSLQTNKINYSISQVTVSYPNLFRDGIFGDYFLERNVILSGSYSIQNSSVLSIANTFNYEVTDTIKYNDLTFAENSSIPFTKGNVPPSPLFPSLVEPVIAITTVAVTVILFFSVRSK